MKKLKLEWFEFGEGVRCSLSVLHVQNDCELPASGRVP